MQGTRKSFVIFLQAPAVDQGVRVVRKKTGQVGGWSVYVTEPPIANGATRLHAQLLGPMIVSPQSHVPDPAEGSPSGQRTR
ncbi:hypothetical protein CEP54_015863 [Fusarium duplospermum]|uniref:Uncharacterized protein n=1 Tax=Fusarium duplospermum TaxID=1325734 RepID=A0A428NKH8_9HYPO|nr:hypothetical protein CEP54_015863 [Fusarium duplospermum]